MLTEKTDTETFRDEIRRRLKQSPRQSDHLANNGSVITRCTLQYLNRLELKHAETAELHRSLYPTPFGDCLLTTKGEQIYGLEFIEKGEEAPWQSSPPGDLFARMIAAIFDSGDNPPAKPLPLVLIGTPFQLRVWRELAAIPAGTVISYGDLAKRVGSPQAYRAVGTAVGANPISYLIPCHRVVRSNGEPGGYRWGTARKKAILEAEFARHPLA